MAEMAVKKTEGLNLHLCLTKVLLCLVLKKGEPNSVPVTVIILHVFWVLLRATNQARNKLQLSRVRTSKTHLVRNHGDVQYSVDEHRPSVPCPPESLK